MDDNRAEIAYICRRQRLWFEQFFNLDTIDSIVLLQDQVSRLLDFASMTLIVDAEELQAAMHVFSSS